MLGSCSVDREEERNKDKTPKILFKIVLKGYLGYLVKFKLFLYDGGY